MRKSGTHVTLSVNEAVQEAAAAYSTGKYELAHALYTAIVKVSPENRTALNYLGAVSFQLGERQLGLKLLEKSCRDGKTDTQMLLNYAAGLEEVGDTESAVALCRRAANQDRRNVAVLLRMAQLYLGCGGWEEALGVLERAQGLEAENLMVHVYMNRALYELGRSAEAIGQGESALLIRDKETRPGTGLRPLQKSRTGRNVVAFSLWGKEHRYLAGALANAELVRSLFPDWTARFYCDAGLDASLMDALRARGAEILIRTLDHKQPWLALFWRFEAANDPELSRFLCRDVDSRLSEKERAAVDAWIESRQPFHVMRDHACHVDLMLAGMWGGTAGRLPPLGTLIRKFVTRDARRWVDQAFLSRFVWPLIRGWALLHDSHYGLFQAVPFPVQASGAYECRDHIGSCVTPSAKERAKLQSILRYPAR